MRLLSMRSVVLTALVAVLFLLVDQSHGVTQEPKNILWYGNSFTNATCCGSSLPLPVVFSLVAQSAGQLQPSMFNASVNGESLQYHLTTPSQLAWISSVNIPGGQWDHVVLQDFSTSPTHIGNLTEHLSSSLGLCQAVASHSPDVVPV